VSYLAKSAFTDLRVWRDAMELAIQVYRVTSVFPKDEVYSLTQQMRRGGSFNTKQYCRREGAKSAKEFCQYLFHARGSLLELQTPVMIARRLDYLSEQQTGSVLGLAGQVGRSLSGLINSLHEQTA
jgi:four helix bundle protein